MCSAAIITTSTAQVRTIAASMAVGAITAINGLGKYAGVGGRMLSIASTCFLLKFDFFSFDDL